MTSAALLLCAALAQTAPRPLRIWHSYRDAEERTLEALVDDFATVNPGYRPELLAIPYDALVSKLSSAIPSGHGPDLFVFAQSQIGAWAASGEIQPIDATAARLQDRFLPAALAATTFDGHTYGLPLSLKCAALYFNRRLVPKPPTTTAELAALAGPLTDPASDRYGLVDEVANFYYQAAWLHGFGGQILDAAGTPQLDTPQAEAALAFAVGLSRFGPPEVSGALVTSLFGSGRAAMAISGPWLAGEIPALSASDYGVVPLPTVSTTGLPARPLLTVEALLVPSTAHELAGALLLAEALTAPAASVRRALEARQVVATKAAYDDPRVAADPLLAAFRSAAEQAVPLDNRPAMSLVWEPERRALASALAGGDPGAALRQAQRRLNAVTRPAAPARQPWPYLALAVVLLAGFAGYQALRRGPREGNDGARAVPYLLPASLGIALLVGIPIFVGLALAFFDHRAGHYTFVGFSNFVRILTARDYRLTEPMNFYFTLGVTVLWTIANLVVHLTIGMSLALLLNSKGLRFKGVYRAALILPWAVPSYLTALVWKGMFHRQYGAINALLRHLGIQPISWFTHFSTAFAANVATNSWLGFPFLMVVILGALQSLPSEIFDAAAIDGVSPVRQFFHLTLPLLRPALVPTLILSSVWTFNMFNVIYLVSGGEPGGATDILVSEAYRWAFERNEQYGFAAAYSTLIFLLLVGYAALTRRLTTRAGEA